MTSWDLLYNILRANFDGMATEGYCPIPASSPSDGHSKYLYGHKVTSISEHSTSTSSGISISFEDKDGKEGAMDADLLIGADGPSSTVRRLLLPDVERTYAGYVAWRGTVLEESVGKETLECFREKFVFFHASGVQILA